MKILGKVNWGTRREPATSVKVNIAPREVGLRTLGPQENKKEGNFQKKGGGKVQSKKV